MKRLVAILILIIMTGSITDSFAQSKCKLKPSQTLLLYPEGQNVDKGLEPALGPLKSNGHTADKEVLSSKGILTCVGDNARIELFFPKKPNGQMVIVCPGGGYWKVATWLEGLYVAEWLLKQDITVCVLNYRVAEKIHEIPLRDVQNALRYCRAHASEWGVNQIGVMGFSAGGHLAACASNLYVDDVTRPDFAVLIYPVTSFNSKYVKNGTREHLLGKAEEWADKKKFDELAEYYSMENHVTSKTPATFLACCMDDKGVPVTQSTEYYNCLYAAKVPAELHVYPKGGHGWGFATEKYKGKGKDKFAYARNEFETSLSRWLAGLR